MSNLIIENMLNIKKQKKKAIHIITIAVLKKIHVKLRTPLTTLFYI